MGIFTNIRVIAKHASRLGQCPSTTRAFRPCNVNCVVIKDVERGGFCFTGGVGKTSPVVARLLAEEVLISKRPPSSSYQASCFQFRLGGCKGVLSVDRYKESGSLPLGSSCYERQPHMLTPCLSMDVSYVFKPLTSSCFVQILVVSVKILCY
jgi:RNA-dependent RNA polymerase